MTTVTSGKIVALDVGNARIGVATAHSSVMIASPLTVISHDVNVMPALAALMAEQQASILVIGLPRNLEGDDTAQTKLVRDFAAAAEAQLKLPVILQDEALTSHKAEEELTALGKSYGRGDVDALAATYILEDYLQEQRNST